MQNAFGSLSDDEVRQIALLVETLDRSTFDFLQLDVGDLKVTIGKGSVPPALAAPVAASTAAPATQSPPPAPVAPPPAPAAALEPSAPAAPKQATRLEEGMLAITAPMMGRFYAQPEPGAPPFVTVGSEVNPDTTVGLIEVMKVFSAVRAGVSGIVTEMCVQDAHFVEYGDILFQVRPAESGAKAA